MPNLLTRIFITYEPRTVEKWDGISHYFLFVIGFLQSFGNWRIPKLILMCRGTSFLIQYVIAYIIVGIPLFYLENTIGQHFQLGASKSHQTIGRLYQGFGMSQIVLAFYLLVYQSSFLTYSIGYLIESLNDEGLPWQSENEDSQITWKQDYFYKDFLDVTPSVDEVGEINETLYQYYVIAAVVVFIVGMRGLPSLKKISYITVPLAVGMTLFLFGWSVVYQLQYNVKNLFLQFDLMTFFSLRIWFATFNYVFQELALGIGAHLLFSSYKKQHQAFLWPNITAPCINVFLNMLHAFFFFVFSAPFINSADPEQLESYTAPEITFAIFSSGATSNESGQLMCQIYFTALVLFYLHGQISFLQIVSGNIEDEKFIINGGEFKRELLRFFVMLIAFMCGIIFVYQGGYYFSSLFLMGIFEIGAIALAILECFVFAWVYSIDRIDYELTEIYNEEVPEQIMGNVFQNTPIVLLAILVVNAFKAFFVILQYPLWVFGSFICFLGIPSLVSLYFYSKYKDGKMSEEEKEILIELDKLEKM